MSLYGHSLACLCLDGSSDGKLLATGGVSDDVRTALLAEDRALRECVVVAGAVLDALASRGCGVGEMLALFDSA